MNIEEKAHITTNRFVDRETKLWTVSLQYVIVLVKTNFLSSQLM